jgi:hypothetical protein
MFWPYGPLLFLPPMALVRTCSVGFVKSMCDTHVSPSSGEYLCAHAAIVAPSR